MFLRFFVSNFLSFGKEVEFNLFPARLKSNKEHIYEVRGGVEILRSSAIYGANGSGKSNFIKAIHYLHDVVVKGDLNENEIPLTPFKLDSKSINNPSIFGVEFFINNKYYEYTISVKEKIILKETLYETHPKKNDRTLIFLREQKNNKIKINVNPIYYKTEKDKLRFEIYEDDLLPNQSFIFSVKNKFTQVKQPFKWFKENLWILYPKSRYFLTLRLCFDENYKSFLNTLLPMLGTGMSNIDILSIPIDDFFGIDDKESQTKLIENINESKGLLPFQQNNKDYLARKIDSNFIIEKVITYNSDENGEKIQFEPEEQSDGSRRILDLVPAIHKMITENSVFFIDEIDRSLHPSMIKELLRYFMQSKSKGQLVFTTHESNLLDLEIFRQDEIWFSEKNNKGESTLYPLSEFKPRYDLDIQKGYLSGRFGAIPFLGNFKDLKWEYAEDTPVQER